MANDLTVTLLDADDFLCIENDEVGELGYGSHGIVRLARHQSFGWVAVKCFAVTGGPPDRKALEKRVKKEVAVLVRATNENVVKIHGWVKWARSMGLVMEFLPAGSLRQFTCGTAARLSAKLILRIATEIASGLAFMHNLPGERRIAHGDLKPENILLTRDLHCKVADFGSAEIIAMTGCTTTTNNSKKSRKIHVTMTYAAPERLRDLNISVKKEQDTYSFGMLLFVLLTGKLPYRCAGHEQAFLESIKRGERPSLNPADHLDRKLDDSDAQIMQLLMDVVRTCWQQEPCDRPSMVLIRDDLEEALNSYSVHQIYEDMLDVVKHMSTEIPSQKKHHFLPLTDFSPLRGQFIKEVIHNEFNLPNAQQVALDCQNVNFVNDEAADDRRSSHGSFTQSDNSDCQSAPLLRHNASSPPSRHDVSGSSSIPEAEETRRSCGFLQADDRRASNGSFTQSDNSNCQSAPLLRHNVSSSPSRHDVSGSSSIPEVEETRRSCGFLQDPATVLKKSLEVSQFLLEYRMRVETGKWVEARELQSAVASFIEHVLHTPPEVVRNCAANLQEQEKHLESIALFDAAAFLSRNAGDHVAELKRIRYCIEGMNDANKTVVFADPGAKTIVRDHVIPMMRDHLRRMRGFAVDRRIKCLEVVLALHCIERSEERAEEWEEAGQTLAVAIKSMDDVFGSDATRYRIYGSLLNNLGHVQERRSQLWDAASLYRRAVQAHKLATNHRSREERRQRIEESRSNLTLVQERLAVTSE